MFFEGSSDRTNIVSGRNINQDYIRVIRTINPPNAYIANVQFVWICHVLYTWIWQINNQNIFVICSRNWSLTNSNMIANKHNPTWKYLITPSMSSRSSSCLAIIRSVKAIRNIVSMPSDRKQSMILIDKQNYEKKRSQRRSTCNILEEAVRWWRW